MFIGHFAVGMLSKRSDELPSLAMMFLAVQLLDLVWPILVLLGVESLSIDPNNTKLTHLSFDFYPYSQSLLAAVVWGLLLGIVYFLVTKNKKGSMILGLLVISHWILDLITHRPDLPLSPFSESKFGFGLWNYPVFEMILEISIFLLGAWLYFKSSFFKRKIWFWALIVFLLVAHIMNLVGPPPPNTTVVAWSANLMWIIILWTWWIEKKSSVQS